MKKLKMKKKKKSNLHSKDKKDGGRNVHARTTLLRGQGAGHLGSQKSDNKYCRCTSHHTLKSASRSVHSMQAEAATPHR